MINENRFYVYADTRSNGDLFYIGKGTGPRFLTVCRQNIHWIKIVKKDKGFSRKILHYNLTEEKAYEIEKKLIKLYRKTVVNISNGTIYKRVRIRKKQPVRTTVISFKVKKEHYKELKAFGRQMLKEMGYTLYKDRQ